MTFACIGNLKKIETGNDLHKWGKAKKKEFQLILALLIKLLQFKQ